jgi:hypothetical protein
MSDLARIIAAYEGAFPSEQWSFGFSSPDPVRRKATAWLSNRQPSHIGFDNLPNPKCRYYASEGSTIEEAAKAVLRRALGHGVAS